MIKFHNVEINLPNKMKPLFRNVGFAKEVCATCPFLSFFLSFFILVYGLLK